MLSKTRPLVFALVLSFSIQPPARASNDGALCQSIVGVVVCGVALVAMGVNQLLPDPPYRRVVKGIHAGDAEKVKWLLENYPDAMKPEDALDHAIRSYVSMSDPGKNAGKIQIIEHITSKAIDVSGAQGSQYLTTVVRGDGSGSSEQLDARKTVLVKFLLARGASAEGVDYSKCVPGSEIPALLLAAKSAAGESAKIHE